jgi:hypothetical protein
MPATKSSRQLSPCESRLVLAVANSRTCALAALRRSWRHSRRHRLREMEPRRAGTSYNESISIAGDATARSSSRLMMPPPIPDWRKRQARLDWHHSQNFDAVAAEPPPPVTATVTASGRVGKTYHEAITCAGNAHVESVGTRLRESPLPWRRRRQILLAWLCRHWDAIFSRAVF